MYVHDIVYLQWDLEILSKRKFYKLQMNQKLESYQSMILRTLKFSSHQALSDL